MNPNEPRFCHIDLALSKDSAGVSIGHVPGFRHMNRGDYVETLPIIQFDMILEVRPPRGGEIEFENIRKLIYTLRDSMKVPIKWISFRPVPVARIRCRSCTSRASWSATSRWTSTPWPTT